MASPEETPNPIQKRLKEAIESAGISQRNLGVRCGIDPSVASSRVNHYCTGRHVPNFSVLARMAVVLKVPVAYFYTPDDDLASLLVSYHQLPLRARKELARTSERLAGGFGS